MLETEWVLRYAYCLNQKTIHHAFEKLLGLARVTVEDEPCIIQTLNWYRDGFNFADALHLASSQQAEKFAALDKAFIKKAKKHHQHLITMDS